jgi:hypothetical protein
MMKLEDVKNLRNMVDFAEGLANDISLGIESVDGKCDAELIADLVVHCMDLAEDETIKKLKKLNKLNKPWNLLSEKRPVCDNPEQDGGLLSEAILIRNTSGFIYEVFVRQYPDYEPLVFFTADSVDFNPGAIYIDNVVEWMEIPKN